MGLEWSDTFTYHIPDQETIDKITGSFRFILTAQNELGVSRIASTNVAINDNGMDLTYWQSQDEDDYSGMLPIVGKNINRAVRIFGNDEPVKVTINGVDVTSTKYSRANSSFAYDAYYGIGTNFGMISSAGNISFTTRGYHTITIEAIYPDGEVITETREIGVWGLNVNAKQDTNFSSEAYYIFRNRYYSTTMLYDNGNYLSGEVLSEPLYRSLFRIRNGVVQNVATGDYCTGFNNVQIEASNDTQGLQYQFSYSNTNGFSISYYSSDYYRTYYWKQTSYATTNISRNANGNYRWDIYEVTPVAP